MTDSLADTLTDRITHWGKKQTDIRAVFLLGSPAREMYPSDQWADWDVLVVCVDPEPYLLGAAWLETIAPVWLTFLEPASVGNLTERRVLFQGGTDADFIFVSSTLMNHWAQHGFPEELKTVAKRGLSVLVNKDDLSGLSDDISDDPSERWLAPSEAEFIQLVQEFLYNGVWVAKKLQRHEMWTAKWGLDTTMKRQLLTMIQWHTRATQSWRRNIWQDGRYLEEWADERVAENLRTAFAAYDPPAIAPALKQTIYLFHLLAAETARAWQYAFPPQFYKEVIGWINDNL